MAQRFILTGPPGAGKTTLIGELARLGHDVVQEAATDVIAREQAAGIDAPWQQPAFIGKILELQRLREAAPMQGKVRFSDRSAFCTLALAEFLDHAVPNGALEAAGRLAASGWFERRVLYVETLGFIVNTAARQISHQDALRFGAVHREVYRRFGFELAPVASGHVAARVSDVLAIAAG